MGFKLLPAEKSDMAELVAIFHEAFATDPEFSIIYGGCDRQEVLADDLASYELEYEKPGRRFFKIVDEENGRIAAMSKWRFPSTLTPEEEAAGKGKTKMPDSFPAGAVRELAHAFFGELVTKRNAYFDYKTQYFVHILATRPEYQRKGLGAMLLEDGLAFADRDGCKTYIEASAKGLGLYLRYDWKEFDEIVVDTRPYGGQEVAVTKCMMRDPQPMKSVKG